jgi:hypothetical protein
MKQNVEPTHPFAPGSYLTGTNDPILLHRDSSAFSPVHVIPH